MLLLLLAAVVSAAPNCRAPDSFIPDPTTRCDTAAECTFCDRNHASFQFLCCEDGGGWVAAHVTLPLAFYMFWQAPVWSALVVLLWEIFEVTTLSVYNSFLVVSTDDADKLRLYEAVPALKNHIADPKSPDYVVVCMRPDRVRRMMTPDMGYEDVPLR